MTDTKDEKHSFREVLKLKNAELWEVTNDQCSLKDKGELELLFKKDFIFFVLRLHDNAWTLDINLQVFIFTNISPDWKIFAYCAPGGGIYFLKIAGLDFKTDNHPEIINFGTILRQNDRCLINESGDLIPWFSQFLKHDSSSIIPLTKSSYHDAYPDLPNYREILLYDEIFWYDHQTFNTVDVYQSELNKIYAKVREMKKGQGEGLWAQLFGDNGNPDFGKFFSELSIDQKPDQTQSDLVQKVEGQQNLGQGFDQNYSLFFEVIRIKNTELWEATSTNYSLKYKGDIVLLYSKKLDLLLLRIHDHTFVVDKSLQVITLTNDELGFIYFAICSPDGFDLIKLRGKVLKGCGSIEPAVTSNLYCTLREKSTMKECVQYKDKFALFQEAKPSSVSEKPDPKYGYERGSNNYLSYCSVEYVLSVDRQSFPVKLISQSELDDAKTKTSNLSKYYEGSGIWQHLCNDNIGSEFLENYFSNLHSSNELEQLPKDQPGKGQQNLGKGSEQQDEDQGWHLVKSHEGFDSRTMGNVPQQGGYLKEISAP